MSCLLQLDEGQQGHDAQSGTHGEVLGEENLLDSAEGVAWQVEVESQAGHEGHPHLGAEVRCEGSKVGQRDENVGTGLRCWAGGAINRSLRFSRRRLAYEVGPQYKQDEGDEQHRDCMRWLRGTGEDSKGKAERRTRSG